MTASTMPGQEAVGRYDISNNSITLAHQDPEASVITAVHETGHALHLASRTMQHPLDSSMRVPKVHDTADAHGMIDQQPGEIPAFSAHAEAVADSYQMTHGGPAVRTQRQLDMTYGGMGVFRSDPHAHETYARTVDDFARTHEFPQHAFPSEEGAERLKPGGEVMGFAANQRLPGMEDHAEEATKTRVRSTDLWEDHVKATAPRSMRK